MDWIEIIGVILGGTLGATGIWKFLGMLINIRIDNQYRKAEITKLKAETETIQIENWEKWAEELKESNAQLKEANEILKASNEEFKKWNEKLDELVIKLQSELSELKDRVIESEKHNRKLIEELQIIKNNKG